MVGLGLFGIGTAVSTNAASVFLTRFFGGIFGSAPVSNVSAALGDMYEPKARGIAVTFYAVCVVGGPTVGPVIGSALTANKELGWRWVEYIEAIWVFVACISSFFFMPELYGPVLLKRKAQRLRKETGDDRYWHPHEAEKININNIVTKHLSRPLKMLVTEPSSNTSRMARLISGAIESTVSLSKCRSSGIGRVLVTTTSAAGLFLSRSTAGSDRIA